MFIVKKNRIDKLLERLKEPVIVINAGFKRVRIMDGDGNFYSFRDDGSFHGSCIRPGHRLK